MRGDLARPGAAPPEWDLVSIAVSHTTFGSLSAADWRDFSVAANMTLALLWLPISVAGTLLAPDAYTGMAAIGVANWLSWIVNLLIAEWWLERTDFGVRGRARCAARREPSTA